AEAIEDLRLDDTSPIDESCRGFEARIERRQRIMKAPGATRSVPDRLQNRAVFLFGEAVSPGMGCLKLRPVKPRVIEPEIRGSNLRAIGMDDYIPRQCLPIYPSQFAVEVSRLLVFAPVADCGGVVRARSHRRRRFDYETSPQIMESVERPGLHQKIRVGADGR